MSKNICRVCLKKDPILQSIFDLTSSADGSKITIKEMLTFCSSITISPNYPKSICLACTDICRKTYNFIQQIRKNNSIFEALDTEKSLQAQNAAFGVDQIKIEYVDDRDSMIDDPLAGESFVDVGKIENQPESYNNSKGNDCDKVGKRKIAKSVTKSSKGDKKHECPICHERYRFYSSFTKHIKLHPNEIACNLCDRVCENSDEFQKHYFKDHYNVCNICNVSFALRKQFENHKACVHKDLVVPNLALRGRSCKRKFEPATEKILAYKCPNCANEYPTLNKTVKHLNQAHEGEEILCNHCEEKFSQSSDYLYHFEYKHLNYCNICDLNIDIRTSFVRHKRNHQEKACFFKAKPHKCPLCATQCPNFDDFINHMNGSHNEAVKCIICDEKLDNVGFYIEHYQAEHRIKCNRCNVFCTTSAQFEAHINRNYTEPKAESANSPSKPKAEYLNKRRKGYKHTCPICACAIDKLGEFRVHISHSHVDYDSSTPVACNCCNAINKNLQDFLQHYQSEHYVKCNQCKVFFTNKYSLQEHDCRPNDKPRIKYTIRDKMCSICGKTYKGSLKVHLESHQNQANYKCDMCDATFVGYCQLRYHRLKKHNLMKHLCPDCGQMFVNKTHLKEHSWIHTGVKAYACNECDQRFTTLGSLKKHHLKLNCGKRKNYQRVIKKDASDQT